MIFLNNNLIEGVYIKLANIKIWHTLFTLVSRVLCYKCYKTTLVNIYRYLL